MTNFMSDGATVGALGLIVMPMARLGGLSVWKVEIDLFLCFLLCHDSHCRNTKQCHRLWHGPGPGDGGKTDKCHGLPEIRSSFIPAVFGGYLGCLYIRLLEFNILAGLVINAR